MIRERVSVEMLVFSGKDQEKFCQKYSEKVFFFCFERNFGVMQNTKVIWKSKISVENISSNINLKVYQKNVL